MQRGNLSNKEIPFDSLCPNSTKLLAHLFASLKIKVKRIRPNIELVKAPVQRFGGLISSTGIYIHRAPYQTSQMQKLFTLIFTYISFRKYSQTV